MSDQPKPQVKRPTKRAFGLISLMGTGNLPYLVVAGLSAAMFMAGRASSNQHLRVAVAEKSAVVMQAVLENPQMSRAQLDEQVKAPIMKVMQRYAAAGYAVIEAGADEAGGYSVLALPVGSVDITAELRAAANLPTLTPQPPQGAAQIKRAAQSGTTSRVGQLPSSSSQATQTTQTTQAGSQ
jgi:hypothetical protein